MDNLTLEALIQELRPRILNKSIQKVRSTEGRALILSFRSNVTDYLVLSLHPAVPTLFVSDEDWPADESPSDALLTLRKYLVGGRVSQVRKELADRLVFLDIENYRLSERAERFTFVLELIPTKVRVLLLDEQQKVIAVLPQTREGSVALGSSYRPPALKAGHRVDEIRQEQFLELFSTHSAASAWKEVSGLSPLFVREVAQRSGTVPKQAWVELQALLHQIRQGPYSPRIYSFERSGGFPLPRSGRWVVSPVALKSLSHEACETFASMNDASRTLCRQILQREAGKAQLQSRLTIVSATLRKRLRLLKNLRGDLARTQQAELFKLYADLLYAQPDKSPKGMEKIRVVNLFDPQLAEIEVPLDPRGSFIQNANRYSRLYQKANRSVPLLQAKMQRLETEIESLKSQHQELSAAMSGSSMSWKRPAAHHEVPKKQRGVSKSSLRAGSSFPDPALRRKVAKSFVSSEGLEILVGRSSKDNDVLTLKVARNEDFWLHVAGYGGSHVVLRNPAKLAVAPRQSLLEAAQLAAYFSQARNAPKVEIHYTQKRFVSKPKGAKPGLVRLKEYNSILARPQLLGEVDGQEENR
jgi:predicted ribosome quality control (RQC) complex YloA/Tae2 family protein